MKKLTLLSFFLFSLNILLAQESYWQQRVNYKIDVELDDENHLLNGFEEFEYINNSPDALDRIYVHLWPNAYDNSNTALAKQQYEQGDEELHFASERKKGRIDSLDFKVNGTKVQWELDLEHIDIAVIHLQEVLMPGESVIITTPFRVKIPSGSISRLGHIGQSYQITQWYPKPAVYDKDGWHAMPYLNQGEFYSEYGSYDVSIRLPRNYVVGATGDLQTDSEKIFLDSIALETEKHIQKADYSKQLRAKTANVTPPTSSEWKTIRYTQDNVHDFAWFADKRYMVLKGEVETPHNKQKVTTWAMFTPKNQSLWKDASEYLHDAIYYYSLWNGDYPYKQVTAVDGTISAGGGMEYPNVTVIGNSNSPTQLEIVIVHEVGHNWFYGQLGSNERVHGWMDEGMNTLNEVRYMQTKYPDNASLTDMVMGTRFHFEDLDHHDMSDFSYRLIAGFGEDQPIETHSAHFTSANYGIVMYQKTGLVFYYLKDYLGEELFDQCMREYYAEWEFKHPQPDDMRRSLEKTSGKDLSWLFDDLINTTKHVDFKLKSVIKVGEDQYRITVKNKGQVNGPVEVSGRSSNGNIVTTWLEPTALKKDKTTLSIKDPVEFKIDYGKDIPEINRQNNTAKAKGLFKKWEKPKFEFFIGDNEEDRSNIFWSPMIAGNVYDKTMLGVTFHNYAVPFNPLTFQVTPLYSFGRQMVSGSADIIYTYLPAKGLKTSRFGVSVKTFKNDSTFQRNESYYFAVQPFWYAKIGNRGDAKSFSQDIRVQSIYRQDVFGPFTSEHAGAYLEYNYYYDRPDHEVHFQARNEYYANINNEDQFGRLFGSAEYRYRYMKRNQTRWISLRLFAGQQYMRDFDPATGFQYSMSLSGTTGQQDVFIDEYYLARNEFSGFWSQQRQENMGGFKSATYYGTTSIGMLAANFYMQLPIPTGIFGVFADYGGFHDGTEIRTAFQTGLGIRLGEFVGFYFPLYMTQELNDSFGSGAKYGEKIRVTLKLNLLNKPLHLSKLL